MEILDIGCGTSKIINSVGLDKTQYGNVDIVHDLNIFPYPFDNNSFDIIYCYNILEHLENVILVMEEIHRISKNNAIINIVVPTPSSHDLWNDLTHKRAFTSTSFDYFIRGTNVSKYNTNSTFFELANVEYEFGQKRKRLIERLLLKLANRYKRTYEGHFQYWFQIYSIYFELKVIK